MFKWTKITQDEIAALHMTAESAVYFMLKMYMGTNGIAYPSAATLADKTGLSIHSVRAARKKLLEKGLIKRAGFDENTQAARFILSSQGTNQNTPPTNENTTPPTNQSTTPPTNENIRGGNTLLSTNIEKENKNIKDSNKTKKINPFYLLPRLD